MEYEPRTPLPDVKWRQLVPGYERPAPKTTFERASHAVEDALAADENHPDDIARAVLLAIRSVNGHGVELDWWSDRVVDSILKEATQ